MMRFALALSALAVSACAPTMPDSGAGVGFDNYQNYNNYRSSRDAELSGSALPTAPTVATSSLASDEPITAATLNEAGIGQGQPGANIAAPESGFRVTVTTENEGISDEQNFSAVSERQTIESDAARLAAQREAYKVIAPTALPTRSGAEGPNIVEYALTNRNALGQRAYGRSSLNTNSRYLRNCDKYASPDLAQEAFLRAGGPDRDRMGIDPDGDGFACSWDPTPFRRAQSANG